MSQEPDEEPLPDEVPAPGPPVPWTGGDLLLVAVANQLIVMVVAYVLLGTGLLAASVPHGDYLNTLYRKDGQKEAQQAFGQVAGPASTIAEAAVTAELNARLTLWASALAFPLQLLILPALILRQYPGSAAAFGATGHGWRRAVLLALAGWAVLAPVCLGLNWLVTQVYYAWVPGPPPEHGLVRVLQVGLLPVERVFWVVFALVAAPVVEEFLFRGLFQGYALADPRRGRFLLLFALILAAYHAAPRVLAAQDGPGWERLDAYMPILFALFVGAGYYVAMEYAAGTRLPAFVAVSLLFAAMHPTWPQPVALFVLSMGLCYLREWSGSLLTPILVHGLFNGTSTVLYLFLTR